MRKNVKLLEKEAVAMETRYNGERHDALDGDAISRLPHESDDEGAPD